MNRLIVQKKHPTKPNEKHKQRFHLPNKETRKAIADIEKDKNLIEAKDLDDLFKKLGI